MNNNQGRRRTRRVRQQRKQKNTQISRILLTVCMMAMVAVISIGGTIAWLTDNTETIVNTFTKSDVTVELTETDTNDNDGNALTNSYKMVPGMTVAKDPKVTVKSGSEPCYVFVKFTKSDNYDNFMEPYATTDQWAALENVEGVYYYKNVVDASTEAKDLQVLQNNQLTVKTGVTKDMMKALNADNNPKLSVIAYAVQQAGFTYGNTGDKYSNIEDAMAAAWAAIQNPTGATNP